MTTPSISPINCANTYICPGVGNGYGIQFNITNADVSNLLQPSGLTIAAAATANKPSELYSNISSTTSSGTDASSAPVRNIANSSAPVTDIASSTVPLTWWWYNVVLQYSGLPGSTPMTCVQPGQIGFATGLAQLIISAFNVSPYRICNAKLHPTFDVNDIDIAHVKFTFYITNIRPASPLRNDYLPAACIGEWVVLWMARSNSILSPVESNILVTNEIPAKIQSANCPALDPNAPSPTLYFTNEINIDNDTPIFIEKLKDSFSPVFSEKSFISNLLKSNNIEHATNLVGTSLILNGADTNVYATPKTLFDYYGMYAFPLSFLGAILFALVQIIDININTMLVNRNLSMVINLSFILWSLISLSVFYNFSPSSIPGIGHIFDYQVDYILPFNTQSVITQA